MFWHNFCYYFVLILFIAVVLFEENVFSTFPEPVLYALITQYSFEIGLYIPFKYLSFNIFKYTVPNFILLLALNK